MSEIISFIVRLDEASTETCKVDYTTVNETAIGGVDYVIERGTLTFPPGTTQLELAVPVLADPAANADKRFQVMLSNPINAGIDPTSASDEYIISVYTGPVTLPTLNIGAAVVSVVTPAALTPLSAAGNQFIDATGKKIRLRGINWYGCETTNYLPHGMYTTGVGYKDLLNLIAELGFNFIRLPFADDWFSATVLINSTGGVQFVDPNANPDLIGLTPLAALDVIIAYGASLGIRFMLDQHRISTSAINADDAANNAYGTDGWPAADPSITGNYYVDGGSYTIAHWQQFWVSVATHFSSGQYAAGGAAYGAIMGFDPHNEPWRITWAVWVGMVEGLAPLVHAVAPDWMVAVEGVWQFGSDEYWYGGQLMGVAGQPVVIPKQNKVFYQTHEYGQEVSPQPWLSSVDPANTVSGYPNNLEAVFDTHWGFIYRQQIAPLLIGEFGGRFGYNGTGAVDTTQVNAPLEIQWLDKMIQYANGVRNDGSSMIMNPGDCPISTAYFALNPESTTRVNGVENGGIGGLLEDDYVTVQAGKMALLAPLFEV
jgi:aryl-phospho-beta-D-glucosidase BglC (GH1 family)